jgi:SAM-dependent methyltransferase
MTPAQLRVRVRLALTTRGAGRHRPANPTVSAGGATDERPWPDDLGVPRCPVCMSDLPAPSTLPDRLILSCATCGTGVTWPPPDPNLESDDLFTARYEGTRLARRDVWTREARQRVDWLQLQVPEGTLLELGPATGEFLEAAAGAGYSVSGVEASTWAAGHSRTLGLDVTTGFLPDWRAEHPGIKVDAVVMWHVLEHVADPAALLRELREVLGATGHVVVEVPNFASSLAAADGAQWEFALLGDHYFHYTPSGIGRLFRDAGYDVDTVLEFSTRIYETVGKWHERRNRALLERISWPSLDLLRVTARVGAEPQH